MKWHEWAEILRRGPSKPYRVSWGCVINYHAGKPPRIFLGTKLGYVHHNTNHGKMASGILRLTISQRQDTLRIFVTMLSRRMVSRCILHQQWDLLTSYSCPRRKKERADPMQRWPRMIKIRSIHSADCTTEKESLKSNCKPNRCVWDLCSRSSAILLHRLSAHDLDDCRITLYYCFHDVLLIDHPMRVLMVHFVATTERQRRPRRNIHRVGISRRRWTHAVRPTIFSCRLSLSQVH